MIQPEAFEADWLNTFMIYILILISLLREFKLNFLDFLKYKRDIRIEVFSIDKKQRRKYPKPIKMTKRRQNFILFYEEPKERSLTATFIVVKVEKFII